MCSSHPRIIKKSRDELESVLDRIKAEVADSDYLLIKTIKRRGSDEAKMFQDCPFTDRLLKAFESPTPARKVYEMRIHLEWLLRELRL